MTEKDKIIVRQKAEIDRLQDRLGQAEARIATDERLAADNNNLRAALENVRKWLIHEAIVPVNHALIRAIDKALAEPSGENKR